jgi:small subunit ribosomal protein S14
MKRSVIKDSKLRSRVANKELSRIILRFLFVNLLNNKNISVTKKRILAKYLISKMISKKSPTKVVRRCVLTGRRSTSNRLFGISRSKLKEMLQEGVFPGIHKAIW